MHGHRRSRVEHRQHIAHYVNNLYNTQEGMVFVDNQILNGLGPLGTEITKPVSSVNTVSDNVVPSTTQNGFTQKYNRV
jgi:hypothetical protein